MHKDFFKWHHQKRNIHEHKDRPFFHERQVWFAKLGANVGFEEDGKGEEFLRPVVVLKKFSRKVLWAVPTTRSEKQGKYYLAFKYSENDISTAILSQLRLIDSKRLVFRIGNINRDDFLEMKKRITSLLE